MTDPHLHTGARPASSRPTWKGLSVALVTALALLSGGCAATWQTPMGCAAIGGGLGAIGGATGGAIHADDHDDLEGAAIALGSTVAGAGLGYLVCHLMQDDEPEAKPAKAAASAPVQPTPEPAPEPAPAPVPVAAPVVAPAPDPCEGLVRLEGVNFDSNQAAIRPDAAPILDGTVETLRACEDKRVLVEAYTDASGPSAYNEALSQRRADAVRDYLVAGGVAADRIDAVGRGEADPVASNQTPEGREQNRRVEIRPVE
ncbi:MAG: OmpA family protein [Myxococcota bacterium]